MEGWSERGRRDKKPRAELDKHRHSNLPSWNTRRRPLACSRRWAHPRENTLSPTPHLPAHRDILYSCPLLPFWHCPPPSLAPSVQGLTSSFSQREHGPRALIWVGHGTGFRERKLFNSKSFFALVRLLGTQACV